MLPAFPFWEREPVSETRGARSLKCSPNTVAGCEMDYYVIPLVHNGNISPFVDYQCMIYGNSWTLDKSCQFCLIAEHPNFSLVLRLSVCHLRQY